MQTWKITLDSPVKPGKADGRLYDSPTDESRERDIQTLHVMCANRTVYWEFDVMNDDVVFLTGDATSLETILPALSGKPTREVLDAEVLTFSRSERDKLLCEQYLYSSTVPTVQDVADAFGITTALAYEILRKNRIPLRTKRDKRREEIEAAIPRVQNDTVKDILLDYLDGLNYKELAEKYHKSQSYIVKITALDNMSIIPEDIYNSLAELWESSFYNINYCADVLNIEVSDVRKYLRELGYNITTAYIADALRNECNLMRKTITEQTTEILALKAELRK